MTRPKTSDHSTEWIMPRGTATRALRVSSEVWAESVEARDRVKRIEEADREGDGAPARARRHEAASELARIVGESEDARQIKRVAPKIRNIDGQDDRHHQDEVAGKIGQCRGGS